MLQRIRTTGHPRNMYILYSDGFTSHLSSALTFVSHYDKPNRTDRNVYTAKQIFMHKVNTFFLNTQRIANSFFSTKRNIPHNYIHAN